MIIHQIEYIMSPLIFKYIDKLYGWLSIRGVHGKHSSSPKFPIKIIKRKKHTNIIKLLNTK